METGQIITNTMTAANGIAFTLTDGSTAVIQFSATFGEVIVSTLLLFLLILQIFQVAADAAERTNP